MSGGLAGQNACLLLFAALCVTSCGKQKNAMYETDRSAMDVGVNESLGVL